MDATLLLVMLAMGLSIVGLMIAAHRRTSRQQLGPLEDEFGAELGGALTPLARFRLQDARVTMRVVSAATAEALLRLEAELPNAGHVTCRIRPLRVFDSVQRWLGRGVLTGHRRFDELFFVEAEDTQAMREALDSDAQGALITLYRGLHEVVIGEGRLRIDAVLPAVLIARQADILLERLLGRTEHAVEFLDDGSGPLRIAPDSACPVCGERIDSGELVHCRVCSTPHHRDCWKYAGGCAIYACGSRRASR